MARNKKQAKLQFPESCKSRIEYVVSTLLDKMDVLYEQNATIGKYTVDFLTDRGVIIECYGDFWHCNPNTYIDSYYNKPLQMTASQKRTKDQQRVDELKSQGYDVVCLWEYDIKNNPSYICSQLATLI